jgi:hypothetical protein
MSQCKQQNVVSKMSRVPVKQAFTKQPWLINHHHEEKAEESWPQYIHFSNAYCANG